MEAGETQTDIQVEGKFPIEVKKNPKQSTYDMLLGQLTRNYLTCFPIIKIFPKSVFLFIMCVLTAKGGDAFHFGN